MCWSSSCGSKQERALPSGRFDCKLGALDVGHDAIGMAQREQSIVLVAVNSKLVACSCDFSQNLGRRTCVTKHSLIVQDTTRVKNRLKAFGVDEERFYPLPLTPWKENIPGWAISLLSSWLW
jgi:hypothetical protein